MKKILIHSLFSILVLVPHIAVAQALITEIMYDPAGADSGHEWIEVYNNGTSSIPLTNWKVSIGGANHKISAVSGGTIMTAGSYGVIATNAAKFESDYPNFSGLLLHSSLSLGNNGATIIVRDASLAAIDTVTYDGSSGAIGDGNSLQRPPEDAAQFSPHVPTPGAVLSTAVVPQKTLQQPSSNNKRQTVSKRSSKKNTSLPEVNPAPEQASDQAIIDGTTSQAAALATPLPRESDDSYWWLAAGALVLVAGGTVVASRHFKKTEWDIVEEKPEDV